MNFKPARFKYIIDYRYLLAFLKINDYGSETDGCSREVKTGLTFSLIEVLLT